MNGACYKIWRVFFASKNVVKVVHSLGCFLFVTSTNYGSNSSRKVKWYINCGVT